MYKILIVDDEQLIRDGLRKIIAWDEHGIEIAGEASNGLEALDAVQRLKPNLLLTDIRMPMMDGLKLIRTLREKRLDTKIIIISGYDDFQYVKEALKYGVENYIIKPINREELSSTLLSAVEKIQSETIDSIRSRENEFVTRDNILYRLVTNRISRKELEEKSSLLGIDKKDCFFTAALIKALKREGNLDGISDSGGNLLGLAMINIINETILGHFNCNIFLDLNSDAVIIFHSDSKDRIADKIEAVLVKCIENINHFLKTDVFIAVGKTQEAITSIHESYKTAGDLLQYFVIFPRNYIMRSENSERAPRNQESRHLDHDRLKTLIMECKRDEIISFFNLHHDNRIKTTGVTIEYMNNFTLEVLACLIDTIKSVFTETEGILKTHEELFSGLLKQNKPEDLAAAAKNAALTLVEMIRHNKEKPKMLVDQIIEYVNSNYFSQELSLKALSHQFNFTAPYLGQLLKKKTGELFSDYLNGIRLGYAKELLMNTHLKATEISEKIGYSDPNYFYRAFKKNTGVYPSEFRGYSSPDERQNRQRSE